MRTVLRRRKAVSSIVATLMLMLITVTTLSITLVFVQSNLTRGEAENNFVFAKVFMKTLGLQVDDVAWQTGQMDTIQYSSRDGEMFLREGILEYEVKVKYVGVTGETIVANYMLNGLFFSVPISKYSLDNSYFTELLPGDMSTLILSRSTDPVTRVFVVQKNPIGPEGDYESEYIRIGVIPVIRATSYSITTTSDVGTTTTKYCKLLLAKLQTGLGTPSAPQYVTLLGTDITARVLKGVETLTVTVSYPRSGEYYNSEFFRFPQETQTLNFGTDGAEVEIYVSTVEVGYKN
jgi:flagellin-like protein